MAAIALVLALAIFIPIQVLSDSSEEEIPDGPQNIPTPTPDDSLPAQVPVLDILYNRSVGSPVNTVGFGNAAATLSPFGGDCSIGDVIPNQQWGNCQTSEDMKKVFIKWPYTGECANMPYMLELDRFGNYVLDASPYDMYGITYDPNYRNDNTRTSNDSTLETALGIDFAELLGLDLATEEQNLPLFGRYANVFTPLIDSGQIAVPYYNFAINPAGTIGVIASLDFNRNGVLYPVVRTGASWVVSVDTPRRPIGIASTAEFFGNTIVFSDRRMFVNCSRVSSGSLSRSGAGIYVYEVDPLADASSVFEFAQLRNQPIQSTSSETSTFAQTFDVASNGNFVVAADPAQSKAYMFDIDERITLEETVASGVDGFGKDVGSSQVGNVRVASVLADDSFFSWTRDINEEEWSSSTRYSPSTAEGVTWDRLYQSGNVVALTSTSDDDTYIAYYRYDVEAREFVSGTALDPQLTLQYPELASFNLKANGATVLVSQSTNDAVIGPTLNFFKN